MHIWRARRSDAPAPRRARLERWNRILAESCKQCGRARVPGLEALDGLPAVAAGAVGLIFLPGEATGLEQALGQEPPPETEIWMAVGPESGIEDLERDAALGAGWRSVGLGPRVLRTETAGVVAAALLQHRLGDLDGV